MASWRTPYERAMYEWCRGEGASLHVGYEGAREVGQEQKIETDPLVQCARESSVSLVPLVPLLNLVVLWVSWKELKEQACSCHLSRIMCRGIMS